MVTHHMGFAREFADRVIFLDGGTILEDTSPAVFFDHPAHQRSREFLRAVLAP
jgi:ABC-type polar amino acid transport system ATPase subunit